MVYPLGLVLIQISEFAKKMKALVNRDEQNQRLKGKITKIIVSEKATNNLSSKIFTKATIPLIVGLDVFYKKII